MATIIQYPHYLFSVTATGESVQDENGNWTEAQESVEFVSMCREETNGQGAQIQIAGGTFYVFASLIQLPKNSPRVEIGTTVFVANDEAGSDIRIKGQSLKFDNGQLHSRLWV
jgi:hypothetical protein